ncbi:omptin family outer membrane protease [Rhizobium sp. TH2]|uniref:omptin family outer membrane protease n=1 Tax=Rhizobium sp. TH2 TaxID=2775403 RepID=UPI0021577E7F|nr:omptin family outer membrane protease [Rhizobium sp. TH2]UVC10691.1 omptin family outer membrane protease [Rhizobium sp. TH2]
MNFRALAACMTLVSAPVASQAGDMLLSSADGTVIFRGSYGITAVKANELVWEGKAKVSQLIWKSQGISTFTGDATFALDKSFYLKAIGTIGFGGDGYMADYDWFNPGGPWTHRSQHPDTRLDHYFALGLEAGREVLSYDGTAVSLGGGFKYTDVKWSAYGGSYVYSDTGFRADRGKFPDGEKGISYQQQWPVPYLGVNLSHTEGAWTFGSALQGGIAVNADGTDDHWMRDLRFIDHFDTTPAVMISASAEYEFRPDTAFYLSGSFDHMFRTRADTDEIDKLTGDKHKFPDGAGADYQSVTVSLGLRGRF